MAVLRKYTVYFTLPLFQTVFMVYCAVWLLSAAQPDILIPDNQKDHVPRQDFSCICVATWS